MKKKHNWQEFQVLLNEIGITKLYHFTDRDNLKSIIDHGGLYSWMDCEQKGIRIPKPGGESLSRSLDSNKGLQNYARVSFTPRHPMMFAAMNEGRISNPVILEISPEVLYWDNTKFADRNATKNGVHIGDKIEDLKRIHFDLFKGRSYFDMDEEEQMYFKAEALVKNFIPLKYITNIENFGYTIPSISKQMQTKIPYTAQITRSTPTAFIFLIDQSVSMQRTTNLYGEEMPMAEAVARIVNSQINNLVLRCIKGAEVRDYYDIAIIGYGENAYSGWCGELYGRDFVKPSELKEHPYKKITTRKETRTRKGVKVVEVQEVQWIEAICNKRWTHVHDAFDRAQILLNKWMEEHHNQDCYPPTIINITDGLFNGTTKEHVIQQTNELRSMFTNDGNVILFNIHIAPSAASSVLCPISKDEVSISDPQTKADKDFNIIAPTMFELSSLLPTRYNEQISTLRNETDRTTRHVAMAVNADMSSLIQLMDIGTPTNICQNQ